MRHRLAPRDLEERLARALAVPRAWPAVGEPAIREGSTGRGSRGRRRVDRDHGAAVAAVLRAVVLRIDPSCLLTSRSRREESRRGSEELARVVRLGEATTHHTHTTTTTTAATRRENHENQTDEQQGALRDGHALLEDDLVGEDAEALAEGDELALGLLTLRLERDHRRLPDGVALGPGVAQLHQHRAVQLPEEGVHPAHLAALEPRQRAAQELGLLLDVLEGEGRVGLEGLEALGQGLEEGVLHRGGRRRRG